MKFFLISDNTDTGMGMRLAGIEGVVVHEAEEVERALRDACADPEIGILLITAKLMALCRETVLEHKRRGNYPLIVEVMDRHGEGRIADSLTRYVREAVGIKL